MRALGTTIAAPPFPRNLPWVNVAHLHMHRLRGRPVLVEFWDFCRVNSLRTLPYLKAWHERYADAGLRIVGVHTGAFPPSRVEENVRRAVARLQIPWPVAIDTDLEVWDIYGNEGWPARYLWDPEQILHSLHYGEGAYEETEREIQALLGVEREPLAPLRPEDRPGALLAPQTPDQPGAYHGPYAAGSVWAVVDGSRTAIPRYNVCTSVAYGRPVRSAAGSRRTREAANEIGCRTSGARRRSRCESFHRTVRRRSPRAARRPPDPAVAARPGCGTPSGDRRGPPSAASTTAAADARRCRAA